MMTNQPDTDSMIHSLSRHVLGNPVVFAASQLKPGARHRLVLQLLRAAARLDHRANPITDQTAFTLRKNSLGAPVLFVEDNPGPSVSFSRGRETMWAAICSTDRVGIDAANPEEFNEAVKKASENVMSSFATQMFGSLGTSGGVDMYNSTGELPIKYWKFFGRIMD